MYVLVVDTATPAVTAAVVEVNPGAVILRSVRTTVNPRAHGELLAPAIRTVLDDVDVAMPDLGAVIAGVGPGPYTGLRVGLVTATAIAQVLDVPSYGVCSLDGIGGSDPAAGRLLAATDARRREIYWRVYERAAPVTEPAVDRPDAVAERIAALAVTRAVGEGALRYADVLGVPTGEPHYPDPLVLAGIAAERIRSAAPSEPLTPLYLRRPDVAAPATRKPVLH
ncbi:MAG TPA: tRNA (adenosine(37)-N6)-threonylcarbamoyltransferase complex dimerization subunit type 1 TsaB [Micromonosporaceae bacterium]|nr:tRNA (adenosine(37)-N6)-threonylcarbamoyltransferase complex dimerization subunit type 1 TsaB [Micromonosporaceae bacterium]